MQVPTAILLARSDNSVASGDRFSGPLAVGREGGPLLDILQQTHSVGLERVPNRSFSNPRPAISFQVGRIACHQLRDEVSEAFGHRRRQQRITHHCSALTPSLQDVDGLMCEELSEGPENLF